MKVRPISATQPLALSRGEQESGPMQGLTNELLRPPATGNRGDQKKKKGGGEAKVVVFFGIERIPICLKRSHSAENVSKSDFQK